MRVMTVEVPQNQKISGGRNNEGEKMSDLVFFEEEQIGRVHV